MSSDTQSRVFVARLVGTEVFDPIGDKVGFVHDVVVVFRLQGAPMAVGLVIDMARRRVFLPFTRVTAIRDGQVITTGVVNVRRFAKRNVEHLVVGQLLDREVTIKATGDAATVVDAAIERVRPKEWALTQVYVRGSGPRRGESNIFSISEVTGLASPAKYQGTATLAAQIQGLKAADVADILHDLPGDRMVAVARSLTDERLADIIEELSDDDRLTVIAGLNLHRAAEVLDVMQPDDAADLIADLKPSTAARLLDYMGENKAEDVRRLMSYDERTAGGLMTTSPLILSPDDSVAKALASAQRPDLPPALATIFFVTRPPMETPTGRYIGAVHLQRALREPPSTMLGSIIDADVEGIEPDASLSAVTRELATYNLTALPVVDNGLLVGAVSVDDVLDHILPEDWRDDDETEGEQWNEGEEWHTDGEEESHDSTGSTGTPHAEPATHEKED